jgi:hypothetical protein
MPELNLERLSEVVAIHYGCTTNRGFKKVVVVAVCG